MEDYRSYPVKTIPVDVSYLSDKEKEDIKDLLFTLKDLRSLIDCWLEDVYFRDLLHIDEIRDVFSEDSEKIPRGWRHLSFVRDALKNLNNLSQ